VDSNSVETPAVLIASGNFFLVLFDDGCHLFIHPGRKRRRFMGGNNVSRHFICAFRDIFPETPLASSEKMVRMTQKTGAGIKPI